ERDGVVAVPPLDQRVLRAGVYGVALQKSYRYLYRVHDVKDGDRYDRRDVEPYRDVEVLHAPYRYRAEVVYGEDDPDDGYGDVERPFELGVFLSVRISQ